MAKEGTQTIAKEGTETLAKEGTETLAKESAETVTKGSSEALAQETASSPKLLDTARGNLLSDAQNPKLRNLVDKLYRRNAQIGSGSTADAIRYELKTGQLLSPSGHFIKGQEVRTALRRLIRSQALDEGDRQIARYLLRDIQNSLSGL